jgi:hypothetical protein
MKTGVHFIRILFLLNGLLIYTFNPVLFANQLIPDEIFLKAIDEAPVLGNIETESLSYDKGDGEVQITETLTVADEDSRYLQSATVQITSGFNDTEDVLSCSRHHNISISWNQTTGVLSLTGRATRDDYRRALRNVFYENTNRTNPSAVTRTVSFVVNDGNENSNTVSRDIIINSPNSPSQLTNIETNPIIYCLNSGPVIITSSIRISDNDNSNLNSATVQLTTGYRSNEDILRFTSQNGITGAWSASTGTLSLTGISTIANYQEAFRSIRYENTNLLNPVAENRIVSFIVNDGTSSSNTLSRSVDVHGRVSAVLTGSVNISDEDNTSVPLSINFTGTAPWIFTLTRDNAHKATYDHVWQNPYVFYVNHEGTYRITSIADAYCQGDTAGSGYAMVTYKAAPTAAISGADTICQGESGTLTIILTGTSPWNITYLRNGRNPTDVNSITNSNYDLHVSAAGTYTLSYVEDATGKGKVSGSGTITQMQAPTAVISGSATICENTSANLTVSLTGSSPWKFSYRRNSEPPVEVLNVSASPKTLPVRYAGTYKLTEVSDKYCEGTVSGSATINITPAPEVTITGLAPAYNISTLRVPVFASPAGGTFEPHPALIDPPPPDTLFFYPVVAGVGTHYIIYSYRSPTTSCYGYDTAIVRVLAANATIAFENNRTKYCVNDQPFTIEGVNLAEVIGSFSISGGIGLVDHHDNTATISPSQLSLGDYTITYTYYDGTSLSVKSGFEVGNKPLADFNWESECYHQGQSISISDASSSSFGFINSYKYKIFTGTGYDSLITKDITYTFALPGNYNIELQISTSYGCKGSVTKSLGLRPVIALQEQNYFEDFESIPLSWKSATSPLITVNSWVLGNPDKGFSGAMSGEKCWYTYIPTTNAPREQSWITSPCFDFTGVKKPMLKLSIWRLFNSVRDGAVIQVTSEDSKTWQNVGQLQDGVNWFNEYNLIGPTPGDQTIGWSNVRDGSWIEARHDLNMLKDKKDVQFRLAYGSDGTARNNDGIAFDNFWLGERNRTALIEHFTNSSDLLCKDANQMLNDIVNADSLNLIDLQFHTSFPGDDPFNQQNPYIISSRIFYYGLTNVPYSILNGGSNSLCRFDYNLRPLDKNTLLIESLYDSKFWININSQLNGNILNIETEISALQDIPTGEFSMHIAVIERKITGVTGNNGETSFESVVKTLLPDAGGTTISKSWTQGEYQHLYQSWTIQNVYNPQELRIVAFIQNESTHEIYQAAIDTIGVISSIDDPLQRQPDNSMFTVYPNPSSMLVNVKFNTPVNKDLTLEIYNNLGSLIFMNNVPEGIRETSLPVENLPDGIYMIRIINQDELVGLCKLIVSK